MDVLVIDVGGSHVKLFASKPQETRRFDSDADLTPERLVEGVKATIGDWSYDAVSIGVPAAVGPRGPRLEPGNLGRGWVNFPFDEAFERPTRVLNDAVMQAIGAYDGGRMLFLGLGTGLGSALISDDVAVYMDLGNLPWPRGRSLGEHVGREALDELGDAEWQRAVTYAVETLRHALVADYVVLGGGNAKRMTTLPHDTRLGGNHDAFIGGVRVWEEPVEPLGRSPGSAWRILR
jgi:polyphosphate glucokinase